MLRRGLALWAASLAAVHTAASAIPMNNLFMRQSSCPLANFNPCNNADFPDYFCCPQGQKCIALAGNTTVLCCKESDSCERIQPLESCDISLQDGTKNPDSVVKTTALGGILPRCGDKCCPFGYSCRNNQCVMDENQNVKPIQTQTLNPTPTSTSRSATSATTSAGTSPTATPSDPVETPATTSAPFEPANEPPKNGPSVAAIAGGVVAGVIVLLGLIVLAIILKKRRRGSESGSPLKFSRSSSSFGNPNPISGPIIRPGDFTSRTDFSSIRPDHHHTQGQHEFKEDPSSVTGAIIDSSANTPATAGMFMPGNFGQQQQAGGYGNFGPSQQQQQQHHGVAAGGYGNLQPPQQQQHQGAAPSGYGNLGSSQSGQWPTIAVHDVDSDGVSLPQTPPNREPSSASIQVFANSDLTPDRLGESFTGRRLSSATTFTQMLGKAGLPDVAKGESFVPPEQQFTVPRSPPKPTGRRLA